MSAKCANVATSNTFKALRPHAHSLLSGIPFSSLHPFASKRSGCLQGLVQPRVFKPTYQERKHNSVQDDTDVASAWRIANDN